LDNVRVIDWAVPPVRVAVTVAVSDEPATMDLLVGFTDNV
jgi:hypothetical protein